MNAPSVDIKSLLEDETVLQLVFGTNLFISKQLRQPKDKLTN